MFSDATHSPLATLRNNARAEAAEAGRTMPADDLAFTNDTEAKIRWRPELTSGSGDGPEKPTRRKADRALRADLTSPTTCSTRPAAGSSTRSVVESRTTRWGIGAAKHDQLYRARRLLTIAHERLAPDRDDRLQGQLRAGDPRGEVRMAWRAMEVLRSVHDIDDADTAAVFVAKLGVDFQDDACPPEVQRLGRTIVRWQHQIAAWHRCRHTNGPTEAINNLGKRVKRVSRSE